MYTIFLNQDKKEYSLIAHSNQMFKDYTDKQIAIYNGQKQDCISYLQDLKIVDLLVLTLN